MYEITKIKPNSLEIVRFCIGSTKILKNPINHYYSSLECVGAVFIYFSAPMC